MNIRTTGAIGTAQMDAVVRATGKRVFVTYINSGTTETSSGVMTQVSPFRNVQVGGDNIPFIGYGIAIRMISVSGNIIYDNKEVPRDYAAKRVRETMYFAKKSFTKEGMALRRVQIPNMLRIQGQ